ncbi:hypothetical protein IV102_35050 [bacterium]|nr:hypothetical protein [bacterium]
MSFQELHKELLSLLHQHGVNTELLAGLETTPPAIEFLTTPAGGRWKEAAREGTLPPLRGLLLGWWLTLHSEAEPARLLAAAGVTESLLSQVLRGIPGEPAPAAPPGSPSPLDVLREMRAHLPATPIPTGWTEEAVEVLLVAWDLCGRRYIQTDDLLRALVHVGVSIEPDSGALRILKKLEADHDLNLASTFQPRMSCMGSIDPSEPLEMRLSDQADRILKLALGEAVGLAGTSHLLWALTAIGEGNAYRILTAIGLSAERIRPFLGDA